MESIIKIIEIPQRSDSKILYKADGDLLTITLDDSVEVFDFTGCPEGRAEEITSEIIKINPILSAEKVGDEITINVIRFYGADEKELFETGKPLTIPLLGGVI